MLRLITNVCAVVALEVLVCVSGRPLYSSGFNLCFVDWRVF